MAFQIRLINHIQSVLVAVVVDRLDGRIVGKPHCVDIVLFHQDNVLSHHLRIHRSSALRRIVVMVDSIDEDGLSIDCEHISLYLNPSEACADADAVLLLSVFEREIQGIEVRRFRCPCMYVLKLS